jgi:transposase
MPRVPWSPEVRVRFWEKVREGCNASAAAECVGVPVSTGSWWVRQAGGMIGISQSQSEGRLSFEQRVMIFWAIRSEEPRKSLRLTVF